LARPLAPYIVYIRASITRSVGHSPTLEDAETASMTLATRAKVKKGGGERGVKIKGLDFLFFVVIRQHGLFRELKMIFTESHLFGEVNMLWTSRVKGGRSGG